MTKWRIFATPLSISASATSRPSVPKSTPCAPSGTDTGIPNLIVSPTPSKPGAGGGLFSLKPEQYSLTTGEKEMQISDEPVMSESEVEAQFSQNALIVLRRRYLRKTKG